MIYFHDIDGKVTNTYSQMSGIEYVLEYDCRGQNINMAIDKSKARMIHVACNSKSYLENWITRHEVLNKILHDGSYYKWAEPDWCVRVSDGDFSYFMRSPIKIDWSGDYHFFPDKRYTK